MGKDSPSPPPAPDYTAAANATAAGNLAMAQQAQQANMVNQYTPYGSLTYKQAGTWGGGTPTFDQARYDAAMKNYQGSLGTDGSGGTGTAPNPQDYYSTGTGGGNPQYSSTIDLSPTGQALLDRSNKTQLGLGNLQGAALGRTQQALDNPMDYQSYKDVSNATYGAQTARLDPQWQQEQKAKETQLANQGVVAGGEAYDNAMRVFNQGKNDAYTQARLAADATIPQTLQTSATLRNQPLNELNALMTGSQVTNPTFGSPPQQQTTAGPNLLGAATSQGQYDQGLFNAATGQANSSNSATMGLLGSAATAAAMFF